MKQKQSIDRKRLARISSSGLFDGVFYLGQHPTLASSNRVEALEHYLSATSDTSHDPHPLFHTSFYVKAHPDVIESGLNPLVHYLEIGGARNYWPNPLFDAGYYRALCGQGSSDPLSPLEHYLKNRRNVTIDTHPILDLTWYSSLQPEASASEFGVLGHYFVQGKGARLSPQPLFDPIYYLERYPDAAADGRLDPVSHFLLKGNDLEYSPHPLFDTAFYYRQNPDVKAAGLNALVHFLKNGGSEGRDPGPWFDSSYYLQHNPDVARAGKNPLVHYVQAGAREGRHPHPMFRAAHWAKLHRLPTNDPRVLMHFVEQMSKEGAHPLESLRLRDRRRASPPGKQPGVNIIGWPRLEIGFGEYVRQIAGAMRTAGIDFGVRDVSLMRPEDPGDDTLRDSIRPDCPRNTNLFVLNADNMSMTCDRLGFETVRDGFNIAMWAWELAEYPDIWRREMSVLDEIWAGSLFNQDCLALKSEVPVVYMPQPVTLSADAGLTRADFHIPDNKFVFLFQFDFTAFIDRKNPYASIAAFRRAFPRRNSGAVLVIKTNNSECYPEKMQVLLDAIGDDEDIVLVNRTFRRRQVMSLMAVSDVFVSLHRSEGFGRSIAEAMLMGKPTVATNYSANTEFMNQENSCLVNYTLAPVREGQYPYAKGQFWAEPDVEHAAWHMRRLMVNRPYRQLLAHAAQKAIAERYSPEVTGQRYRKRLQLLGLLG
jgi:hypothetical protein